MLTECGAWTRWAWTTHLLEETVGRHQGKMLRVLVSGCDKFASMFCILQGLSALGARWGCPKELFSSCYGMLLCSVCVTMVFRDLAAVVFHWRKGKVQV